MPPDAHSAYHAFGARSAHPTTSPIILLRANTAFLCFTWENDGAGGRVS